MCNCASEALVQMMLFPVFSAMSLDAVKIFALTQQTTKCHIKLDSTACGLPAHCAAEQLVVAVGATAHRHMAESHVHTLHMFRTNFPSRGTLICLVILQLVSYT